LLAPPALFYTGSLGDSSNHVNFLGADLVIRPSTRQVSPHLPLLPLTKALASHGFCKIINFSRRDILPLTKSDWVYLPAHNIVMNYNHVWTDILNYYSFAWNRPQLKLIQFLLLHSLACTLARKFKLRSRRQVFLRFGPNIAIVPPVSLGHNRRVAFSVQPTLCRLRGGVNPAPDTLWLLDPPLPRVFTPTLL